MKNEAKTRQSRHPVLTALTALVSMAAAAGVLLVLLGGRAGAVQSGVSRTGMDVVKTFDQNLTNQISDLLADVIPIARTYTLSDSDLVAPEPNPACYGQTADAGALEQVLADAQELLQGESTLLTPDTEILEGSTVSYYLDETIFAVTWKQVVDGGVYTFSEVKLAHASQFRRFLSEGTYGSSVLHTTTEMAESVNAVVAASGDYYGYRSIGIVVYEGQVYRDRGHYLDTCYIDDNGDLLFTYAGEITDKETAQQYVDEHNVRFSLSFGPVMLLDGEYCVPADYNSGEIDKPYARAALCQMGPLHYVVVTANNEDPYFNVPTVGEMALRLQEMGVPTAYALDGGQTASIVMGGELINSVSYGAQREISDIIYFATAVPASNWQEAAS